ncbi:hypothetical protein DENSPDRAFT_841190 [Dentipellis sp. KUC8613]|nr:hypothetical protein DENSPDRAFT_841190 [Dentipellis sp. KUC8613]
MSFSASAVIPILRCWPQLPVEEGHQIRLEHPVCKQALIEVAPDREDVIENMVNMEQFRNTLKIHASDPSHWVFQAREKKDSRIREPSMRMTRIRGGLRRSHSVGSLLSASKRLENLTQRKNDWIWTPNSPISDCVISPRPLGPTHILVAYETAPLSGIYSRFFECPINAAVFVAHCPNLQVSWKGRTFPHRLPRELPRVLMEVPHLDEFVPLLVYLHTKNQAALFRALIPEWLRDILHPALMAGVADESTQVGRQRRGRMFFLRLGSCFAAPLAPTMDLSQRTIESVSQEIRDAEARASQPLCKGDVRVAFHRLACLKANLEFIGYFPRELWFELELSLKILVRSLRVVDMVAP